MAPSSIDCRANADKCLELVKTAATPEHAEILRSIAKAWLELADKLGPPIRPPLNGREPIARR